jgi:hypothetical protein
MNSTCVRGLGLRPEPSAHDRVDVRPRVVVAHEYPFVVDDEHVAPSAYDRWDAYQGEWARFGAPFEASSGRFAASSRFSVEHPDSPWPNSLKQRQ